MSNNSHHVLTGWPDVMGIKRTKKCWRLIYAARSDICPFTVSPLFGGTVFSYTPSCLECFRSFTWSRRCLTVMQYCAMLRYWWTRLIFLSSFYISSKLEIHRKKWRWQDVMYVVIIHDVEKRCKRIMIRQYMSV